MLLKSRQNLGRGRFSGLVIYSSGGRSLPWLRRLRAASRAAKAESFFFFLLSTGAAAFRLPLPSRRPSREVRAPSFDREALFLHNCRSGVVEVEAALQGAASGCHVRARYVGDITTPVRNLGQMCRCARLRPLRQELLACLNHPA